MNIDVRVPIGKSGNWEIKEFTITEKAASFYNINCHGRPVKPGNYKKLTRNGAMVMSNTPLEIDDFMWFVNVARGDVIVAGLGLGVLLEALIKENETKSITVIEISSDVIKLVAPTFTNIKKIEIINADIFTWQPNGKKWDYGWFDIWDAICFDNLKEMSTLKRKFAKKVKEKHFWCESECRNQR